MRTSPTIIRVLLGLACASSCAQGAPSVPFFEGLGSYQRTVTTRSPEAQRYFNQGLAFLQAKEQQHYVKT